ncbi:putative signal transducing protein [Novispirillum itersonii]|uniref:DUF2007 domain-containing protein n=1 Tax=Novispirillum itersonii TaxID=189 RepID=A0A7W9ZD45_NOVIT|nr:DUF2007 domain-containing protein [Novispirillum itersonii]MBB6209291.1 hypothetical protein [Novispirillum itersonii]
MIEILRTNDVVLLSALEVELTVNHIDTVILDGCSSAAFGGIGMVARRLMVPADQEQEARRVYSDFMKVHG